MQERIGAIVNKLIPVVLVALLVNWLLLILTTRIYDVTLSDTLGLLNILPMNFIVGMIFSAVFSLFLIYLKKYKLSIASTSLFILHFYVTPWVVEPLRQHDTLMHFANVILLNQTGHLSQTSLYSFDYPGNTLFGSIVTQVTGLSEIIFLEYFFPILSMVIFYVGFSLLIYRLFHKISYLSLALLFVAILGYGSVHFSAQGFSIMLLPFLIVFMLTLKTRADTIFFFIVSLSLIMTNPTMTLFLLAAFLTYFIVCKIVNVKEKHIPLLAVFFITCSLAWYSFVSIDTLYSLNNFGLQIFEVLSGGSTSVASSLITSGFAVPEVRLATRSFIGLSVILSLVVLAHFIKNVLSRKSQHAFKSRNLGLFMIPSIIIAGLGSVLVYVLASSSGFGFRGATFAFLGTSIGLGLLNLKSKRRFVILGFFISIIIVPSFVTQYQVEQYDIMRIPIMSGLKFSGDFITNESVSIICPFGEQLYAFMNACMWPTVSTHWVLWHYTTLQGSSYMIDKSDYFVYRLDGVYYNLLGVGAESNNQTATPYYLAYHNISQSSKFNLIYTSGEGCQIFSRIP